MTSLHSLGLAESGRAIRDGSVTSLGLVEGLLERIDQLEPHLQAWVTIDREGALGAATDLDRELEGSGPKGPLHGVPVGLKDIFYTKDLEDHCLFSHIPGLCSLNMTPPAWLNFGKQGWWCWARP